MHSYKYFSDACDYVTGFFLRFEMEKLICSLCGKSYTHRKSLIRHINIHHNCVGNHVCKCGKTYNCKAYLNRHINAVHKNVGSNYECGECGKTYSHKCGLQKHISKIHIRREDNSEGIVIVAKCFECAECGNKYNAKSSLQHHIFVNHLNVQKDDEIDYFECHLCGRKYKSKTGVQRHIYSKHINAYKSSVGKKSFTCVLCSESLPSEIDILRHFENIHELQIITEHHSFENETTFNMWKSNVEKQHRCTYRKLTWHINKNRNEKVQIYKCNRSGFHEPLRHEKRKLKMQGSKKINGFCPSKIVTRISDNDFRKVTFVQSHVGHSNDYKQLAHMCYSSSEKKTIIEKLISGIPPTQIVEDLALSSIESKPKDCLEKIDLLNEQDIRNIAVSYGLSVKHSNPMYRNDAIDIEAWILKNKESVCFYKRQGEDGVSNFGLHRDDFVVVMMKNQQIENFERYTSDMILIEGTHGDADFFMHTILVKDTFGEGYPICFVITNRNDGRIFDIMFNCIRDKVGAVHTKVFMSDVENSHWNSWNRIMEIGPSYHLYCTWHVTREWKKNYFKVKSSRKREAVKQRVLELMYEVDVASFHRSFEEFINDDDKDLQVFTEYFKNTYGWNFEKWAYCYRLHTGVNTNISLERFHKTLKYSYTKELTVQTLIQVDKLLSKKARVESRVDVMGGKLSSKIRACKRDHYRAIVHLNACQITSIKSGKSWRMILFRENNEIKKPKLYLLEKMKGDCVDCPMLCYDCQFCFHQFTCSCLQNSMKSIMCKHIHLLCMKELQDIVPIYCDDISNEIWV